MHQHHAPLTVLYVRCLMSIIYVVSEVNKTAKEWKLQQ